MKPAGGLSCASGCRRFGRVRDREHDAGSMMLSSETMSETFSAFVEEHEARLRHALTARFGPEVGKDAAADALAYGWEHWDRVQAMENPTGYLYTVGADRGRRMVRRRQILFPPVPAPRAPWVEPGLSKAVADLPERQRVVVLLLQGYGWTQREVAEVLEISKGSVQRHDERAMARLRRQLGVDR
jgi:DNA-directed RNA polymerase specialized sigma24 family protein